jgi:hypothetical protein
VSGRRGGEALVGSTGELHGSLLRLRVEEDEVRKVSRLRSTVRAGRWTVACCGAASVSGSAGEVVSRVRDMMEIIRV